MSTAYRIDFTDDRGANLQVVTRPDDPLVDRKMANALARSQAREVGGRVVSVRKIEVKAISPECGAYHKMGQQCDRCGGVHKGKSGFTKLAA